MSEDIGVDFSDDSLRKIAEQKIKYRLTVRVHFLVYFLINLLLLSINLLTYAWYFWFLFPLLGWFIGYALHATAYSLYRRGVYPMSKRTVIIHFVVYFTVILLLFVIDVDLAYRFTVHTPRWFYYPALGWGIAWLLHALIYLMFFSKKLSKEGIGKSRRERAIDREMKRIKRKLNKQYR